MTRLHAGAKAVAAMLAAMRDAPQTFDDLVKLTGVAQPRIASWIKEFRAQSVVRIGQWKADPRGILCVPAFALNTIGRADVARPLSKKDQAKVDRLALRSGGV